MTRLARRASLLVAFFLLASAATTYAECAWVLWRNDPRPAGPGLVTHHWQIVEAFTGMGTRNAVDAGKGQV